MTHTLYSLGELNSSLGLVIALVIGYFFGTFLEKAGFGSSRKLTGIFYLRDMSVLKVMFTAVVTALVGYRYLLAAGMLDRDAVYMLDTYWGAQIVGGLVFGIGFVMGGWCPGTALVGLASAKWDALVFIVGAGLGSIAFNELYDVVRPLYEGGHAGVLFLPESLHVSWKIFPLIFCGIAVVAFAGSTWLERKFGGVATARNLRRAMLNRGAALLLLLAAAGLIVMPEYRPRATADRAGDGQNLLGAVAGAADHIGAEALAQRLMRGGDGLVVVDIRPAADYSRFHIRGAVNVPLAGLRAGLADIPADRTVVLYSNGTTHAAQAWLMARQWGRANVLVLTDGVLGFWQSCLTPPSLGGVLDPGAARAAGKAFRERRAFFVDDIDKPLAGATAPPAPATPPAEAMKTPGLEHHLVSTEWLASHLDAVDVKLIDVRGKSTAYSTAHIPGAVYINDENLRTTIGGYHSMLAPSAEIAATLGRLGISTGDTVVVYSDTLRDATLIAVALERVGHRSYAVLHGGYDKWVAEKRPVTSAIPKVTPVSYAPAEGGDDFTVDTDGLYALVKANGVTVIDVRPEAYFKGEKSDEARPGHIPGALNRPFDTDLADGKALWLTEPVLREAYAKMGLTPDSPIVVNCRTGHQASQTYFLLKHVLGYKNVRWFDASWMAWAARPDLPAATE